jgi:hypothetical protein
MRNLTAGLLDECQQSFRACWVTQSAAGIGGDAGDPDEGGLVVDEEEHTEQPEQHGVDAEEVTGDQGFRLGRGTRPTMAPTAWARVR